MSFKDVLLQISSYPDHTPLAAIDRAIDFAGAQQAHLTALTFKVQLPRVGNALANMLLDVPAMIAAEEKKSVGNVRSVIDHFSTMATNRGVAHAHLIETCAYSALGVAVTERAKMHDITIVPVGADLGTQHYVAECVIFGSGRPTLILPEAQQGNGGLHPDVVGVAWDFSRPAARAVADALPILKRAKSVHIVTITQEKTIATGLASGELARHLAHHGIEAKLEEEKAAGRSIGEALEEWAAARRIDLLVMGAYGHSRLRDFVLGGATKSVISQPKLPVLLSH